MRTIFAAVAMIGATTAVDSATWAEEFAFMQYIAEHNKTYETKEEYTKRMEIWVGHDRIIKEKTNGAQVQVPIHPSKVQITKLKLDKDRKALIERKKAGRSVGGDKGKGKFSEKDVAMADVD